MMNTAREWAYLTEMDTHMPEDTERFERWARAIQADALEAAAQECEHFWNEQKHFARDRKPVETVVIAAAGLAQEAARVCYERIKKLKGQL
jgi:hypothetical protein